MIVSLGDYPWQLRVAIVCSLTAVVVVHELGHAGMARWFGGRPHIRLHAFVGVTHLPWEDARALSRSRQLAVVAAGPTVGLVTAGLAYLARPSLASWSLTFLTLHLYAVLGAVVNLANLLPVLGLDGGHMLRLLVIRSADKARRAYALGITSLITAVVVGLVAVVRQWWIIVVWMAICAIRSTRTVSVTRQDVSGLPAAVREVPDLHRRRNRSGMETLLASLERADADNAARDFTRSALIDLLILDGDLTKADRHSTALTEPKMRDNARLRILLARDPDEGWRQILHRAQIPTPANGGREDPTAARYAAAALSHAPRMFVGDLYWIAQVLALAGRYSEAIAFGTVAWNRGRAGAIAYELACWSAQAGRHHAVNRWLQHATHDGVDTRAGISEDWRLAGQPQPAPSHALLLEAPADTPSNVRNAPAAGRP